MKVNPESLTNLVNDFLASFPQQSKDMKDDADQLLKTFLNFCINKSEILTREEFEVQTKVLAKTRQKLENLEYRLSKLEKN
jgi:BMFP domain-containing protein YqiC